MYLNSPYIIRREPVIWCYAITRRIWSDIYRNFSCFDCHFEKDCNERQAFFTSEDTKWYKLWSCQNVCEALIYLLDNVYIRFGTKLYRQIVGIPMGTNCAPLVADLFLFCYEKDFMTSLSDVKQAEIIEAFKSTSRYLDDLLNIDNPYFEGMVNRIYPPELQLNKANTSDIEAPFLDLHLSISNGFGKICFGQLKILVRY